MNTGEKMLIWMKELWDIPRSITGKGTYNTLQYFTKIHNKIKILSYPSGRHAFDWTIPDEWNIEDAYIEHESGQRFAEFARNNLHILGYSLPCDCYLSLEELLPHIYTQPDQPELIPYVTSYYKDRWGFCMSEKERQGLPKGNYHVVINAVKKPGMLNMGELLLQGQLKKEIFFSTYICHPSMANNELSGPVLSLAIADYIKTHYNKPYYSYRFVFVPETIGSLAYMSDHLDKLKEKVICGFNLSCVGDERAYSHIQSRSGNSLADNALSASLIDLPNVITYSFLERGSDERQYCAPGIDFPLCGFCRSKYGEYPEYHTSADNFDLVTALGLQGSFNVIKSIIDTFEFGLYPKFTVKGEPQLGKRGLYPTLSQKGTYTDIKTRMDFLAYADGQHSLFDIAKIIGKNLELVTREAKIMAQHNLVKIFPSKVIGTVIN